MLTRWPSPIPSTAPDPVKTPSVSIATIQGKRPTTPDLFGDGEGVRTGGGDNAGEEYDLGMVDDDWIIDDIGGGMDDDPPERDMAGKGGRDGFVKEMGKFLLHFDYRMIAC